MILHGSESTEPVRLLDPNTMQPTTKLDFPGGKPVWGVDVAFSADGRYLAATVHTANFWAGPVPQDPGLRGGLGPPTPRPRPPSGCLPEQDAQGIALSPDGQSLYTGWPLTAYDVATGKQIWRRKDVESWGPPDMNTEGTLLAVSLRGKGTSTALVSASTGATVHTLRGHREGAVVVDMRFSPDGSLLGSVSDDDRAHRLGHGHRPAAGTVGHLRSVGRRLQPGQ